jgi:hypothetical protein
MISISLLMRKFDQLPEPQRHIIVEESLAGIHYDTEKVN